MAERLKNRLDSEYPDANANILLPRTLTLEEILGVSLAQELTQMPQYQLIELYEYTNSIKDDRIRDIASLVLSEYL